MKLETKFCKNKNLISYEDTEFWISQYFTNIAKIKIKIFNVQQQTRRLKC